MLFLFTTVVRLLTCAADALGSFAGQG